MSTMNRIWAAALAGFVMVAVQHAGAAEKTGADGQDMAIEKKFSKPTGQSESPEGSGRRSRMGAPQDAARQGLLAQLLVMQTGLYRYLPPNPTDQQCFEALAQNKIEPQAGWDGGKIVTRGDLGRVIVLALDLEDKVTDRADPRAWLDVLSTVGINITTIGEAVENVNPITSPVPGNRFLGERDDGLNLDNEDMAYVLNDVFPAVVKKPVTPN